MNPHYIWGIVWLATVAIGVEGAKTIHAQAKASDAELVREVSRGLKDLIQEWKK